MAAVEEGAQLLVRQVVPEQLAGEQLPQQAAEGPGVGREAAGEAGVGCWGFGGSFYDYDGFEAP